MKYQKLTGIILKKQNNKEADQIITIWTKEFGKIRCLAKSIRLPKSKLNSSMQDLSLVEFEVTGKHLPVLISSVTIKLDNLTNYLCNISPEKSSLLQKIF